MCVCVCESDDIVCRLAIRYFLISRKNLEVYVTVKLHENGIRNVLFICSLFAESSENDRRRPSCDFYILDYIELTSVS